VSLIYPVVKRLIDIVMSAVGLFVTVLLGIPVALAIKLDSPGPVLFVQERMGLGEKVFLIYKFRTMYVSHSRHGAKPVENDERVTRVGRWLRRSSLDELPQFYNVLRGEMSMVGPRPEQLPFASRYEGWQRKRFLVKPGLTGWWQVNGRPQPMYEHMDLDVYYVDHRSLWLDLVILWRSVRAVISGEGAV